MAALAILGLNLGSSIASAQDDAEPQQVDQRVADVSPLSLSLREVEVNLRQPDNFEELFEIPGLGDLPSRYMRSAGALHAVFDRSVYRADGAAEIPANTMFYIGAPPEMPQQSSLGASGALSRDSVYDLAIAPPLAYASPGRSVPRATVRTSAALRSHTPMSLTQNGREMSSVTRSIRVDGGVESDEPSSMSRSDDRLRYVNAGRPSAHAPAPRRVPDAETSPTYVNNRTYRSSRIHELIERAAAAEREAK